MKPIDRHVHGSDMTDQAIEIIRAADQMLAEHGWCQGNYTNAQGQFCTIGALRTARNELVTQRVAEAIPLVDGYLVAVDAVHEVACESWNPSRHTNDITDWNDAEGRTEEDVHLIFKQAIEVLENKNA